MLFSLHGKFLRLYKTKYWKQFRANELGSIFFTVIRNVATSNGGMKFRKSMGGAC